MNPLSLLQPGWKGVLIAAGIGPITGLSAGGWLAWHFTSVSYEAQVSHLKEQHANDLKVISDAAAKNRDDNASAEHSAANQIARDDQKHTQELNDALAENQLCVMLFPLALASCGSQKPVLQPVSCPKIQLPAPPAWVLQEPSNSLLILDETFTTSDPALSATSKN